MTRRLVLAGLAVVLASGAARAHVGSPTVIFEGPAGPHPVRVIVRPPEVVPGLAEVTVRLLAGTAEEVTVQPVWWGAPKDGGAPPPDVARPIRGEPARFTGSLWLMAGGSYAVRVAVRGAAGAGEVLVPVGAVATRRLEMSPAVGAGLLAFGVLLYAGSVSIVRAAVGEAVIAPGEPPDARRRRRGLLAGGLAAVVVGLVVWGLWSWWGAIDAAFRRRLFTPLHVVTTSRVEGNGRILRLAIDDERWLRGRTTPLTPDHGKLMHLFLVRDPGHDALAHLHPAPVRAQEVFEAPLPAIPGGRYRVFADVTHESGFAQTLTDTVTLVDPAGAGRSREGDPDDSFHAPGHLPGVPPYPAPGSSWGSDGYEIRSAPSAEPLVALRPVSLRYHLVGPDGKPAVPEPYMGMAAHAVVLRDDGSVFVHLHPSGTVSMASQQRFHAKLSVAEAMDHSAHAAEDPVLAFPYEFPRPGRYRVWVQAKAAGLVRTAAFDVAVAEATP